MSATTSLVTLCILYGLARIASASTVCSLCNRASCPPVNCSTGTVYDRCNCCQQCALPANYTCDVRGSATDIQRYCAEELVCELDETTGEHTCKGDLEPCKHGDLWSLNSWTFCGCWGGRTVCKAPRRLRPPIIPPTPAIGVFGIMVSPLQRVYQSGSSVNITCEYQGHPQPILVFTRNRRILNTTQVIYHQFEANQGIVHVTTLVLHQLTELDSGTYSCIVMNFAGMAETIQVMVTVQPEFSGEESPSPTNADQVTPNTEIASHAPIFIHSLTFYRAVEGDRVTLQCRSIGQPIPRISIKKNGQNITRSQRLLLAKKVEPERWEKSLTLTFTAALMTDAAEYQCIAQNEIGTATHPMFLQLKRSPVLCTFEIDNCNWTLQEDRSDIQWKRVKASEVNNITGPRTDVTRNASDGHFLYLHSLSSPISQTAVMEGETLEDICYILLWHRVHGDNSTHLKIIVRTQGPDHPKEVRADWTGTSTTKWVKRRVPLKPNPQSRVQIMGKLGRGHNSYIAIDNVQYEKCQTSTRKRLNV